jgi:hypothetical protein
MIPGFESAATDRVPDARFRDLLLGIRLPFYGNVVTSGNNAEVIV